MQKFFLSQYENYAFRLRFCQCTRDCTYSKQLSCDHTRGVLHQFVEGMGCNSIFLYLSNSVNLLCRPDVLQSNRGWCPKVTLVMVAMISVHLYRCILTFYLLAAMHSIVLPLQLRTATHALPKHSVSRECAKLILV